jgi:Fuc2NAc and GlcNAc transferase
MGDAGSGFLGFVFATVALDSTAALETTVWPWVIISGVFVVDASYTLLRRILTGQRWYAAHCTHAYQRAAQRLGGHRPVTLLALFINLAWLLPLACMAQHWPELGASLALLAYLPLLCLVRALRAGVPGDQLAREATREKQAESAVSVADSHA